MKNNKKTKKVILGVCMVLMIALVCGMGAMTYSKYITTADKGTQQATAAKWGFVITANTDNLFGKNYTMAEGASSATVVTENGVAVKASSDGNVVAPGTSGSMTITVNGSAEVRAQLTISMTNMSDIFYDTYYPIQWTLKKGATTTTYTKLEDLSTALNETLTIEAGSSGERNIEISWAWAFDGQNDENDTTIGLLSKGETTTDKQHCETLKFDLAITVEQIQ